MFEVRFRNCIYCANEILFTVFICVCIFLWTSSYKLRRYLLCVGFVEATDCKTVARYSIYKTVTKCIWNFLRAIRNSCYKYLQFQRKHETIMCMLCLSELTLSERMLCPNATVTLTSHSNASLMRCDFSNVIVCRSVSVLLTSTRIFIFIRL